MQKAILILIFCFLTTVSTSHARPTIFGLSSGDTPEFVERMLDQGLEAGQLGDTLTFINALGLRKICVVKIPHMARYNQLRHRLGLGGDCLDKIKAFSKGDGNHAINLPGFLREVARYYPASTYPGKITDVIVRGNILYVDSERSEFSMTKHAFSDGILNASPMDSPLGTKDMKGLEQMEIHLSFPEPEWMSTRHKMMTEETWGKFIQLLGGQMVTFHSDVQIVFDALLDRTRIRPRDYPVSDSTKMFTIPMEQKLHLAKAPIFEKEISSIPLPSAKVKKAHVTTIAAQWDCAGGGDIDLWVRVHPGAMPIYWQRSKTKEGKLFKDFTTGKNMVADNSFETVELDTPFVDMTMLQVRLNVFALNGDSCKGKVRLSAEGKIYEAPFSFSGVKGGNAGIGHEIAFVTIPNKFWQSIDILKMIGREDQRPVVVPSSSIPSSLISRFNSAKRTAPVKPYISVPLTK